MTLAVQLYYNYDYCYVIILIYYYYTYADGFFSETTEKAYIIIMYYDCYDLSTCIGQTLLYNRHKRNIIIITYYIYTYM